MPKDQADWDAAGQKGLNPYSNEYELITLCELLNVGYEEILDSQDIFCTKILLSSLKRTNVQRKYADIKAKK